MSLAQIIQGLIVETDPIDLRDGYHVSQASAALWDDATREGHGLHVIVEPEPREDHRIVSTVLEIRDSKVTRVAEYALDVPVSIPRRKGRLELFAMGVLKPVEDFIANADMETQITYQDAPDWRRDSPFVATLAEALKWDTDTVDQAFIRAAKRP